MQIQLISTHMHTFIYIYINNSESYCLRCDYKTLFMKTVLHLITLLGYVCDLKLIKKLYFFHFGPKIICANKVSRKKAVDSVHSCEKGSKLLHVTVPRDDPVPRVHAVRDSEQSSFTSTIFEAMVTEKGKTTNSSRTNIDTLNFYL